MPAISVVIPTFNAEAFINRCLDSICNQSFYDIEIVVVDDCSTDATREIVKQRASQDARIRLLPHTTNQGTLAARCDGIAATTGDYVTLIDQDDELVPRACEQAYVEMQANPVDILHFGVQVIAESDLAEDAVEGMTRYMTPPAPRTFISDEILEHAFIGMPQGYDWNVHHRLYRGDLARFAVQRVVRERLTLPDDAYISFAINSLAMSYRSVPNAPWYVYRLGKGATLSKLNSAEKIKDIIRQNLRAYELSKEYALQYMSTNGTPSDLAQYALTYLGAILAESTVSEIRFLTEKPEIYDALVMFTESWEPRFVLRELYRIIRDRAFQIAHSEVCDPNAHGCDTSSEEIVFDLDTLVSWANAFEERVDESFDLLDDMRKDARFRLEELEERRAFLANSWNSPIRVFAATQAESNHFESNILQPVQVGAALAPLRFSATHRDDEGETISRENPFYGKVTAQYWAYKNIDAEYYGFCSNDRYFIFNESVQHEEDPWGNVFFPEINDEAAQKYGLDDNSIARCIEGFDVITSRKLDVSKFPECYASMEDQYVRAPFAKQEDLDRVISLVERLHPDYAEDIKAYFAGTESCFSHMFIMRKQVFLEYCEWIFPVLQEFCKEWDVSHLNTAAKRVPEQMAERLLNVFLMHHRRTDADWKEKQLQTVIFQDTQNHAFTLEPLAARVVDEGSPIPIVIPACASLVPMLAATLQSLREHAQQKRLLDVLVLSRDIDAKDQEAIANAFDDSLQHMRVRFVDVNNYFTCCSTDAQAYSTCAKLFVPDILYAYEKAILLDCGLIVEADIAELYDTDLGANVLAAVRDIDFLGNLNKDNGARLAYAADTLHMANPYDYVQTGVLLLNLMGLRELHTLDEWLRLAHAAQFENGDQDVLNVACEGQVHFLEMEWNVLTDTLGRFGAVYAQAPERLFWDYIEARQRPRIIQYFGDVKPWTDPASDYATRFWGYARTTPFYERLLAIMAGQASGNLDAPSGQDAQATHDRSALRKMSECLLPYGSKRRETVKRVVKKTIRS